MSPQVLITGTGLAGTRLLHRLFGELGLPDSSSGAEAWRYEYLETSPGGVAARELLDSKDGTEAPAAAATDDRHFAVAEGFHALLHTLVRCEVPFTLVEFPRFAQDVDYAWQRLRPVLGERDRGRFELVHRRVAHASPDTAHAGQYAVIVRRTPALAQGARRRQRRRQQLQQAAVGLLAAIFIGLGIYRLSQHTIPAGTPPPASQTPVNPEALPEAETAGR